MRHVDETHDPSLRSWVETANDPASEFPIQNLPFGVFRRIGDEAPPRVGVAIGDRIVDVPAVGRNGWLRGRAAEAAAACAAPRLNPLLGLGARHWHALRAGLSELLREDARAAAPDPALAARALVPMDHAELLMPAEIGDFTDFFASIHHATNAGRLFRPDNPLPANYKHVPIAYHGRASSVVVSGSLVRRPHGQTMPGDADGPVFGPSRRLDYEVEVGCFVGTGNALGQPVPIEDAETAIFGICLVNDWSARDIQRWEYQPLGPFLGKSFATTVSPWIVTLDALAPFRVPAPPRPAGDPPPLPYLSAPGDRERGAIDLTVEAYLRTRKMREQDLEPVRLSRGSFRQMYWTLAQMLAHHTSNGCNLRPGDLVASGTVSGDAPDRMGCLLEMTRGGAEPIELPTGEARRFLEDDDEVILRGYCEAEGRRRIGLGECTGVVLPALGDGGEQG